MSDAPRVSIVVTARNDDHGGNLLQRMQIFVDGLLEQARRHNLNSELVLVEWNPPADRPRLVDALKWPEETGPCRVRIIEVPAEIHARYRYADRLGLFQMIAKNVGIRRARAPFVLSTNIDVLFSDELVRFLASGPLDGTVMYRTDRFDVAEDIPTGVQISEQLEFCRDHVLRICTRWGTFEPGEIRWLSLARRVVARPVRLRGEPVRMLPGLGWTAARRAWRLVTRPIHTNACGDFTMLAQERWRALGGYPELEMFSLHLDSVLCEMAMCGGAREVTLGDEMRIYHVEHRSGWSPGEAERLTDKMTGLGVPILSIRQYEAWIEACRRQRGPIIFNGEDWGLGADTLAEIDPIEWRRRRKEARPAAPVQT